MRCFYDKSSMARDDLNKIIVSRLDGYNRIIIKKDFAELNDPRGHVESTEISWGPWFCSVDFVIYAAPEGYAFTCRNKGDEGFINWCFEGKNHEKIPSINGTSIAKFV